MLSYTWEELHLFDIDQFANVLGHCPNISSLVSLMSSFSFVSETTYGTLANYHETLGKWPRL